MVPADTALHGLAAVDLDELTGAAALLTRVDRKYVLPVAELSTVLAGLPAEARVLDIGGHRQFGYQSVYYDTADLDSYFATARRRRRRFKVRVRTYLEADVRFVEVKTRGPRGTTVKHRRLHEGGGSELGEAGRAYAATVLAAERIRTDPLDLAAVLTTCYRRSTLFLPSTGSRVTVDVGLTWALVDGTTLRVPGHAVVETKSTRGTSEVDRLLWSLKHRPCSLSKYGTGLAALRPDLPANRWNTVLRRRLRPGTEERG